MANERQGRDDFKMNRRAMLAGGLAIGAAFALSNTGAGAQDLPDTQPTAVPLGPAIPPEVSGNPNDWPVWNGNYANTRVAANSTITSQNLDSLSVSWSLPITAAASFGAITAPVLVIGDRVYAQDTEANTYALNRDTGAVIWEKQYKANNVGPNGLAVGYGLVFGGIGSTREVYALDAETGEEKWRKVISQNPRESITGAPTLYNNVVYTSTTPSYAGGDRGIIYAQDASNGDVLWIWDTTSDNLWGKAAFNSGGGVWYPFAVDASGNLYFGTGNPAPWPGDNGSSRPGDNLYTSAVVALNPTDGSVLWYYQDAPHDLVDHDFQNSPVLTTIELDGMSTDIVIGSGKTGTVAALLASTGSVLWRVPVGTHTPYGDGEPLPATPVTVLPGIGGGVQVPIAVANGTVYVPCYDQAEYIGKDGNYLTAESQGYDQATGYVVALDAVTGAQKWSVTLDSEPDGAVTVCNDVVFVGTLSGMLLALAADSGEQLWSTELPAGFNAPLSIAGDTIFAAVGGPKIVPASAAATPAAATPAATVPGIYALKLGS